jgi:hypothetical protein
MDYELSQADGNKINEEIKKIEDLTKHLYVSGLGVQVVPLKHAKEFMENAGGKESAEERFKRFQKEGKTVYGVNSMILYATLKTLEESILKIHSIIYKYGIIDKYENR